MSTLFHQLALEKGVRCLYIEFVLYPMRANEVGTERVGHYQARVSVK